MSSIIKDPDQLTPIEEYNGILFKRDDLFQPFDDIPLSGGKVRQAIYLLKNQKDKIKKGYNNTVITATSVQSPQGIIISRVAKEYGMDSILVFGATNQESIKKHNLVLNAMNYATRIDTEAKMGYNTVLDKRITSLMFDEGKDYFHVKFGINLEEDQDAIIDSVSRQCENLPDDLDLLVVPAGSGIMLGGIIKGCKKYNKNCEIIGVQISGYDRSSTINYILNYDPKIKYTQIIDKTYPYSKHLDIHITDDFKLDPVYESKAYDYMIKHIDIKNKKVCFWVVGDSNPVRDKYFTISKEEN